MKLSSTIMSIFSRTASNYVLQIITLAKHAKKEVEKGNYRYVHKLVKHISSVDKKEIKILEHESASKELVLEAKEIINLVNQALNEQKSDNILSLLNKIILLEEHSYLQKVKEFEELKSKIAKEKVNIDRIAYRLGRGIDRMIKPLVATLTYVGYETTQSCHGHKDWGTPFPWLEFQTNRNLSILQQVIVKYNEHSNVKWKLEEFRLMDGIGIVREARDREMKRDEIITIIETANKIIKNYNDEFKVHFQNN